MFLSFSSAILQKLIPEDPAPRTMILKGFRIPIGSSLMVYPRVLVRGHPKSSGALDVAVTGILRLLVSVGIVIEPILISR